MTANINNETVTTTVDGKGNIVVKYGNKTLTIPRAAATSLVTATLAARKEAYEGERTAKAAVKAEAKAAREAAKAAKAEAKAAKREATATKLRERLAALEATAA